MYTEINWDRNEVWFNNIPDTLNFSKIYRKECDNIRLIPSEGNITNVGDVIKENYSVKNFTIELWKLRYNLKENKLYYVKIQDEYVR